MAQHVSSASALSLLLPRPRRLERLEGTWLLPPSLRLACPDQVNAASAIERLEQTLCARGHGLVRTAEPDAAADVRMRIEPLGFGAALPQSLSAQAHAATITNGSATLSASSALGLAYAVSTLTQLIELSSSSPGALELPCLSIEDWPDFPVRGVMLDISRDKVPTLATLQMLVDRLAHWKVNQRNRCTRRRPSA